MKKNENKTKKKNIMVYLYCTYIHVLYHYLCPVKSRWIFPELQLFNFVLFSAKLSRNIYRPCAGLLIFDTLILEISEIKINE